MVNYTKIQCLSQIKSVKTHEFINFGRFYWLFEEQSFSKFRDAIFTIFFENVYAISNKCL